MIRFGEVLFPFNKEKEKTMLMTLISISGIVHYYTQIQMARTVE